MIRTLRRLLTAFCLACSLTAVAAPLPDELSAALRAHRLPERAVGLWLAPLDSQGPVVALNEDRLFTPASVIKLVTTYAALDLLGPDWTETTEFLAPAGPDARGAVRGLALRGGGDPHLVVEQFWLLVEELYQGGARRVVGDIVADRSAFAAADLGPGQPAPDDDARHPYSVLPDPLLVGFKTVSLKVTPLPEGGARVTVFPRLPGWRFPDRVATSSRPCRAWDKSLDITTEGRSIRLTGAFPAACGPKTFHYSLWDSDDYLTGVLRFLFARTGIAWEGRVRRGVAPAGARVLASQDSAPLSTTVVWTNKWSNNAMARQIFLSLSRADEQGRERPASLERSRAVVASWLSAKGLDPAAVRVDNGSGLSRQARLSPRALGLLLADAWRGPLMPVLVSSLPRAGVDGTMRRRPLPAGWGYLKTGRLSGVRSVAGYLRDAGGRDWAVVALVNDEAHQAESGIDFIDAVLAWCARQDRPARR